jgi:phage tail tube protein FII
LEEINMRKVLSFALMCGFIGLLSSTQSPAFAEEDKPQETAKELARDWAGGWNTWLEAKEGDWAEYTMMAGQRVRFEIKKVTQSRITYQHTMIDTEGKETLSREMNREPKALRPLGRLPHQLDVDWSKGQVKMGSLEIDCQIASWISGSTSQAVWYSSLVPCGGMVRQVLDGRVTVWLSAFYTEATGEVQAKEVDTGEQARSDLPEFFQSVGNSYIHRISTGGPEFRYMRRMVSEVQSDRSVLLMYACDEDGAQVNPRADELVQTAEDWARDFSEPVQKDVTVKVPAGEFKTNVFKKTEANREITYWMSEAGVIIKQVTKAGERETTFEAIRIDINKK